MTGPQTPRDAIQRARESYAGLDKSRAIRVSLSMFIAVIVVTSMVVVATQINIDYTSTPDGYSGDQSDNTDTYTCCGGVTITTRDVHHNLITGNDSVYNAKIKLFQAQNVTLARHYMYFWLIDKSEDKAIAVRMRYNDGDTVGDSFDIVKYDKTTGDVHRTDNETFLVTNDGVGTGYFRDLEGGDWTLFVNMSYNGTHWNIGLEHPNGSIVNGDFEGTVTASEAGITPSEIDRARFELASINPDDVSLETSSPGYIRMLTTDGGTPIEHRVQNFNYTADPTTTIEGYVVDPNGNGISDAVVTAEKDNTERLTVTNSDGFYSVEVPEGGTYNMTAEADGWTTEKTSATVTEGETVTDVNITLFSKIDLFIDTDTHLCHGESADYTIDSILSDKPGAERNDVTDNATLTSDNDDVLSVDETNHTITATRNLTVGQAVTLTATWENSSETKDVFVGEMTVDNIQEMENNLDMLVGLWGNTACRDGADPPGGTQNTMLWIFASLAASIIVTRFSTTFGGLSAFAVMMTVGWFVGGVGEGMIMLTWAFGIFLGLNVATNFEAFKR